MALMHVFTKMHTHTCTYIYICVCVCVCECIQVRQKKKKRGREGESIGQSQQLRVLLILLTTQNDIFSLSLSFIVTIVLFIQAFTDWSLFSNFPPRSRSVSHCCFVGFFRNSSGEITDNNNNRRLKALSKQRNVHN